MFSPDFKAIFPTAHARRCPGVLYWCTKNDCAVPSITPTMLCQPC